MKVLINTGFNTTHNTIQSRYFFYEMFKRIVEQNREDDFYFLVTPENENDFLFTANCFVIKLKLQQLTGWYKKYWINVKLPSLLRSIRPQIIVQPVEYFSNKIKTPQVLAVCDESSISKKINKTQQIITSTENLKTKINRSFGLNEERINVVYAAPDDIFMPVNEIIKRKTKDEFSWSYEYFLLVDETGSETTLVNVLKAFSVFKNKQKSNMKLLVLSEELLYNRNITEKIKTYKYRNDVILLEEDLKEQAIAEIIASAYAILYLPVYNNSCLPIMWAMQSGVPVITSNNNSTTEVGGTAVLQADELNYENIAGQMLLLYKDENCRNNLIENGLQQVLKFNWDNSAHQFWQQMLKATG